MAQGINDNLDTVDEVATNNEAAPPQTGNARIRHSNACSPCCGTGGLMASLFGSSSPNPAATTSTTASAAVITAPSPVNVLTSSSFSQPEILLDTFKSSINEGSRVTSPFSKYPRRKETASASQSNNAEEPSQRIVETRGETLVEVDTGEVLKRVEEPPSDERRSGALEEYFSSQFDQAVQEIGSELDRQHQRAIAELQENGERLDSMVNIAKETNDMLEEALRLLSGDQREAVPGAKEIEGGPSEPTPQ